MNSCTHGFAILVLGFCLVISACEQPQRQPSDGADTPSEKLQSEPLNNQNTVFDDQQIENALSQNASLDERVSNAAVQAINDADKLTIETGEAELQGDDLKAALVKSIGFFTLKETKLGGNEEVSSDRYCLGQVNVDQGVTVARACELISNRLASVSNENCNAASLQPSPCSSVGGFPIFFSDFVPLKDREPQGRILVIGGIHGDELTSVSVVFRWIAKLNQFHSGLFHWHVVPMMNPDGVLQRAAKRTNKNGVDLNRNMPSDDWREKALQYWRQKQGKNPRRYPGEEPASEPETRWLIDEINEFKPDAIISVHAPYGVVDFDALMLNTAPRSLGKLHLNLLATYPGSLGNYAGIDRNIPVITLELPHAWDMPSEQETTRIWEDIVGWLKKNINPKAADID